MNEALRQLVLIPVSCQWQASSQQDLIQQLTRLGMLGPAITGAPGHCFQVGENFLQQFSFMGCAPDLNFTSANPEQWRANEFVYIQLYASNAAPHWYADTVLGKPACPRCHKRNPGWSARLDPVQATVQCAQCGQHTPVCDWNWFDAGGCARQFISIVNVYPKESIPTDAVLADLASLTGIEWRFFYMHAPLLQSKQTSG